VVVVAVMLVGSTAPAFAEGFIDFYLGAAVTRDSAARVSNPGFSDTQRIDWDASVTSGGRFGFWFDRLEWMGLALDGSFFRPDRDLTVIPISALLMLRVPLMKDKDFAHGRLQPYIGVGPSLFISRLSGDLGDLGGRASDTSLDVGADARGGVMFLLTKSIGIFGEYRFTHVEPAFKVDVLDVRFKTETRLDTHHFLGGVSFRF
jgi:hypothetical protein